MKRETARRPAWPRPDVASSKTGGDATFDGITLTNPGKVYYPDIGLTKLDVARYYETVAPYMLPYVVRRPISLVRCPEGIDKEHFFQRHAMKGMSKAIKEVPIAGGESKKKYLYIDDATGLFGLVQIGTLEIHDWGVSLDHINKPDRLVFDLDPDEGLPLPTLKAAAVEVREFLDDLGFKSFLKSTGGKGLHLVAPIAPKLGWAEVKAFAKAIADALVERPARPLHGEPAEAHARRQDLRRLSPQSARRLGHRQLFDARQAGCAGRLPAPLGRAEGAKGRFALHRQNAAGAAQIAESATRGKDFFLPASRSRQRRAKRSGSVRASPLLPPASRAAKMRLAGAKGAAL